MVLVDSMVRRGRTTPHAADVDPFIVLARAQDFVSKKKQTAQEHEGSRTSRTNHGKKASSAGKSSRGKASKRAKHHDKPQFVDMTNPKSGRSTKPWLQPDQAASSESGSADSGSASPSSSDSASAASSSHSSSSSGAKEKKPQRASSAASAASASRSTNRFTQRRVELSSLDS